MIPNLSKRPLPLLIKTLSCHDAKPQSGQILIDSFHNGMEIKLAQLTTTCQSYQERLQTFDPDLRFIFCLQGLTHLRFGEKDIKLMGSHEDNGYFNGALLPINNKVSGQKFFYKGNQQELVIFCNNLLLEELDLPLSVIKTLRQSHLEPFYFRLSPVMRDHLAQIIKDYNDALQRFSPSASSKHRMTMTTLGDILLLIKQVLTEVFGDQFDPYQSDPQNHKIKKLHWLIKSSSNERLNIKELSSLCYSNPTSLQKEFKATFGTSIGKYYRESRLYTARLMLKHNGDIQMAASFAGYDNPECFSKAFKVFFGKLPSAYCKAYHKTVN